MAESKREDGKVISRIAIEKLSGHPDNPNRMSRSGYLKLREHIRRTGNYEPIVVRAKDGAGGFEIINGHHRCEVLRELGYEEADCVVWDVDDAEALILLNSLNRLGGSDMVEKKGELLRKLRERYSSGELAKMLPISKKSIERLGELGRRKLADSKAVSRSFLEPMVFFVNDEQKEVIEKAIAKADECVKEGNKSERKSRALTVICEGYFSGRKDV